MATKIVTEKPSKSSSKTKAGGHWKNRIVGHDTLSADKILANPLNWRVHGKAQRAAMKAAFSELGWIQNVVINKRTGRLVDGHMRVELSLEAGEDVPVTYVDLSEEEEKLALASIDPIGDMASSDKQVLTQLLKDTSSEDTDELIAALARATNIKEDQYIDPSDLPHEGFGITEVPAAFMTSRAIFSSSNAYDIPDLLPEMLSDQVPHRIWGGKEFGKPDNLSDYLFMKDRIPGEWNPVGAVLGYYVFDDNFEYIWNDAVKSISDLSGRGFSSIIMPDFSVLEDWPFPVRLWNYYRARWVARFWQEIGIRIIPNVIGSYAKDDSWTVATLPKKVPVLSMQVRTFNQHEMMQKLAIRSINVNVEQCSPDAFLLYGGEENRNWIEPNVPKGVEYVWLSSVAKIRSENRKGAKKRNRT